MKYDTFPPPRESMQATLNITIDLRIPAQISTPVNKALGNETHRGCKITNESTPIDKTERKIQFLLHHDQEDSHGHWILGQSPTKPAESLENVHHMAICNENLLEEEWVNERSEWTNERSDNSLEVVLIMSDQTIL